MEKLLEEVRKLNNNTPDGNIIDADTLLADITEQNVSEKEGMRCNGLAEEIFGIWGYSSDKEAVESIFFTFTDVEFKDFLLMCKESITKG